MAEYELSKRAQRDLVKALSTSVQDFGAKQALRFSEKLHEDLSTLAETPNPGTPHRKRRGLFWLPSGSYVVFYRLTHRVKIAVVTRILHQSRLPSLHLL